MTKAAIYCRVDHGSSEYGQVAVSCQRKRLEHYAKRSGLTVTKWYADCGFAGNDLDRPALKNFCGIMQRASSAQSWLFLPTDYTAAVSRILEIGRSKSR